MDIVIQDDIKDFIKSLEETTIAKVLRIIDLLEEYGNELRMPYSRSLGQGLFELRVRGRQEVRLFYTFHDNAAVFVGGFVKKDQNISHRRINQALVKIKQLT